MFWIVLPQNPFGEFSTCGNDTNNCSGPNFTCNGQKICDSDYDCATDFTCNGTFNSKCAAEFSCLGEFDCVGPFDCKGFTCGGSGFGSDSISDGRSGCIGRYTCWPATCTQDFTGSCFRTSCENYCPYPFMP